MTKLEELKLKAELSRVEAAKMEQEYNVAQRLDEIERLKANIEIQELKIVELKQKLNQ